MSNTRTRSRAAARFRGDEEPTAQDIIDFMDKTIKRRCRTRKGALAFFHDVGVRFMKNGTVKVVCI